MNYVTEHQKDLERIAKMRLMDDVFMSCCLNDNIPAMELILGIILGRTLQVIRVTGQAHLKNLHGRSVTLDALAIDESGKYYDVEVQRDDRGATPQRSRYHSSMMDADMLKPGDKWKDLHDSYVIMITENDVLGLGLPIYTIERCITNSDKLKIFNDGSHIIYVNSGIQDDTPLGKLMHDFYCTRADDMHYQVLADQVRYHKEKGVGEMCSIVEEIRREAAAKATAKAAKAAAKAAKEAAKRYREMALRMIESGKLTDEEIAHISGLSLMEIKRLAGEMSA